MKMRHTGAADDRAAAEFLRRHGTMAAHATSYDDDTCEALIEAIPQTGSKEEHDRWRNALEAIDKKHDLTFQEFNEVASGANGEAAKCLLEGYRFGMAIGRRLTDEDVGEGDVDEEGWEHPADEADRPSLADLHESRNRISLVPTRDKGV